ncbi:glycosyltransferase [Arthrobacter sp. CAL618]|uniref:glycosyltransferase n=1 Tax=Arthrobacter sp. CAL618 TaxID=1055770 RepID=UPI00307B2FC4
MTAQVQATGATLKTWTRAAPDEFRDWELKNPLTLARTMADLMFTGPAPSQATDTAAEVDTTRPDLVLTSFPALGAMIAAEARGVPFDVLIPNAYPLPAPGMPPFGGGLAPAHGPLGRLRDRIANAGSTLLFDRYALKAINSVRATAGLQPVAHVWDQLHHARRQLVLTSQAFDFPADLPANACYVGPILDDPAWAVDEPWTPPEGGAPLVLVALSSTFQNQIDCMQRIVDALATLPVRGLVTTGPTIRPSALRTATNVIVVNSAPHTAILRDASLVITHGGHGTVIKTLSAGLPMVILHHGRDQAGNSRRVTDRGAGIAVPRRAPVERIARAVAEILASPVYRESAERLGHAVVAEASNNGLLDALERI